MSKHGCDWSVDWIHFLWSMDLIHPLLVPGTTLPPPIYLKLQIRFSLAKSRESQRLVFRSSIWGKRPVLHFSFSFHRLHALRLCEVTDSDWSQLNGFILIHGVWQALVGRAWMKGLVPQWQPWPGSSTSTCCTPIYIITPHFLFCTRTPWHKVHTIYTPVRVHVAQM